jgi:protein-S-isoprenylcysteine O-methyltransferase Ste14
MAPPERTASPKRFASIVAWTGAAAFALSLLWFVYRYLVVFGRPAPPSSIFPPIATNFLLFSIFALHHSVLARSRPKAMVRRIFAPELERSLYTWVASLLFIGVCAWWQPVPGVLYELSGPFRILAFTLQALGMVFTIRASRALDVLDLAGVRAVQRSDDPRGVQSTTLNTKGLYGFVRHPLYFSWALFVFATPSMTATRATFAIISTAYLMLAIPLEERGLIDAFGDDYRHYQQRVRSRMIPGLY